ncbi:MAG: carbohydrate binding family 9 domain-containing protein [Balneolaceae bacterium]|nr:carbohydrate binding family 9 domain-containing protein [Balneolaceae bacterium]
MKELFVPLMPLKLAALFFIFSLFVDKIAFSQDLNSELPSLFQIEAYKLQPGETFTLDGVMNEPFWDRVQPNRNFTQQEPNEGGIPSQDTEIYVAYDDNYLIIAAKLFDDNPAGILAYQRRRNQSLATDDRFMWILDTFHDGRNAYFFETNPAGLRGDGLLTVGQSTNLNKAWDGIWDVRTSINDEGWVVEVQIPFRSLDFHPENTTWGINFQRTVRRNNEEILWSGWRRNQGLFRPQNAGVLTGLENLNQGLGLEITPFATASGNRSWLNRQNPENDLTADAGLDISYNITPGFRTSLTINTDFAETEVDQRRVNLSRFDISFPEQRDFFLEGASIFSFVPESGVRPYFSRNIGLIAGQQVPIQAGIQALGRHHNTNMGLYQIRTAETDISNKEDFTAARIRQNILSSSSIGLLYTRRATHDVDLLNDRHTIGTDLELNTSRFMGDKNLQFQAFFIWNNMHTPDENTSFWDRTSRGVRVAYPNFPFYWHASYREFGEAFNPAVGFAPRVAFRRFQPSFRYVELLNNSRTFRSWETELYFEYLTDLDFNLETMKIALTPIELTFESGDQIEFSISRDYENLTFDFDILRDGTIIIPTDDYYTWSYNLELRSASYRKISAAIDLTHEGFWTGHRNIYQFDLTIRPWPGINLSADFSRSDVTLEQGNFHTDLVRFRGNVDLSPNTAFTNIIQFDNLSDVLGLYNRFRWTIRPGSDLFLVYTYNWLRMEDMFTPIETQGAVKFRYTHRF